MISALLFATALPLLTQLHTKAPALGNGAGVSDFAFFVAGDNRPDKGDGPADGFTAVITEMQMAKPQPVFVLWGGDTIKGKSSSDAKKQYPIVLNVFAKLNVPVFNTPGNHEMNKKGSGDCNDAPDLSGKLLADYTKLMGPAYGVFTYGNSAFIVVNTDDSLGHINPPSGCYNGFVSKAQREQLEATLAQLQKDDAIQHIFLLMHRPVRDDNHHQMKPDKQDKGTKYATRVNEFLATINALNNPKVAYVFASHDHRYFEATPGGSGTTGFIISGGAGAPLSGCPDKPRPGAYYHYLRVDVSGANVNVTVVPINGTTPCGAP
jgi:hypothetical protein